MGFFEDDDGSGIRRIDHYGPEGEKNYPRKSDQMDDDLHRYIEGIFKRGEKQ